MSETPKAKVNVKKYRIVKGAGGLSFPGFPFSITEEMLNGAKGANFVTMVANYERERGIEVFGKLIVLE